jgi:hypothetical protein
MGIHTWKAGSCISIDPERAYDEMSSLSELTPQNVLDLARNEKTELHRAFEWDDAIAGEKYRLTQARHLIQCIVVRQNKDDKEDVQRVFQISSERSTYKPITYFLENKDEHTKLLEKAKNELYAFQKGTKALQS